MHDIKLRSHFPVFRKLHTGYSLRINYLTTTSTRFIDSKLLESQHQQAKIWGLDLKQWQDYKKELEGARGLWSPNLHPLAVLGMREGITASERQRLAVKLVKIERARVERELAFEKAYQTANYRLFGHIPLYKVESVGNNKNPKGVLSAPSVKYYLKPPCQSCRSQIQQWIAQGKSFALYIDAKDKYQAQQFAKAMGISPLLVPSQITLHLMDQKSMRSLGITTLPAIRKGSK